MKKTFVFLLIAVLSLCIALTAFGRSSEDDNRPEMILKVGPACLNRDVAVTVTNQKGTALESVDIDVVNKNRKVAYGKTDANGVFSFKAKDLGSSQLTAKKTGYKDSTAQVNVSNCAPTTIATTIQTTLYRTTTQPTGTSMDTLLDTTLRTSTTSTRTSTTTLSSCNVNGKCDSGENRNNCPNDCASGSLDGLCDRISDQVCDPDCYRKDDNDCLCNKNGGCETQFENALNCASDCPSGAVDGLCDGIADGKCDKDCPDGAGDTDCKKVDYATMILPLMIILLLFGGAFAYSMKRETAKHQVERSEEDLVEDIKKRLRDGEDPAVIKKELANMGRDASPLEKAEKTIWET